MEEKEGGEIFTRKARSAFARFVTANDFPCLGAKAAWNAGSYVIQTYNELASASATPLLAQQLLTFLSSAKTRAREFATFVAIFNQPDSTTEAEFERLLWRQLQQLDLISARNFEWDPSVSSDPRNPRFCYSFAGQALYIVGLHRNSSRMARRFSWPTLVFNPHAQFEKLRHDGKWLRMQQMIRQRDQDLQGSTNPMLSDFGEVSEARQYSGRIVDETWEPGFRPTIPGESGVCPFQGHK